MTLSDGGGVCGQRDALKTQKGNRAFPVPLFSPTQFLWLAKDRPLARAHDQALLPHILPSAAQMLVEFLRRAGQRTGTEWGQADEQPDFGVMQVSASARRLDSACS
jgi:hypothetical protein